RGNTKPRTTHGAKPHVQIPPHRSGQRSAREANTYRERNHDGRTARIHRSAERGGRRGTKLPFHIHTPRTEASLRAAGEPSSATARNERLAVRCRANTWRALPSSRLHWPRRYGTCRN